MKRISLICLGVLFLTACGSLSENTGEKSKSVETKTVADPSSINVQLGMSYLQQGDMQTAKQKFLLAIQQSPKSAQAQDAMAYYLETTGDDKLAEQYYVNAIAVDPSAGAPQNNYGTFLCKAKRYQDADAHFMLAVQDIHYLNTAQAYENAGLCAMQIPDTAKALVYFQKAVQQDPKRAIAYLELAQIYFNQNNIGLAQQNYMSYSQLTPNQDAEGLWLGVRIAKLTNDKQTAMRNSLLLEDNYPNSYEFHELLKTQSLSHPAV